MDKDNNDNNKSRNKGSFFKRNEDIPFLKLISHDDSYKSTNESDIIEGNTRSFFLIISNQVKTISSMSIFRMFGIMK